MEQSIFFQNPGFEGGILNGGYPGISLRIPPLLTLFHTFEGGVSLASENFLVGFAPHITLLKKRRLWRAFTCNYQSLHCYRNSFALCECFQIKVSLVCFMMEI